MIANKAGLQDDTANQSGNLRVADKSGKHSGKEDASNRDSARRDTRRVCARARGLDGLARFLRLNRSGTGDYSRDRDAWQKDLTLDQILESIRKHRPH